MIIKKRQLIEMALKDSFKSDKLVKQVASQIMNMPEKEFINFIDNELHWRLEAIRKNQYIVL